MKILGHGNTILMNDKEYLIEYSLSKFLKNNVVLGNNKVFVYQSEVRPKTHLEVLKDWLKKEAKRDITNRVYKIGEKNGFSFNQVRVKDVKTRWGSCSSKRNLNFSWKLLLVDQNSMDYVIIHELCHLRQMNHSYKFWNEVEKILPNYKIYRRKLREWEKILV